MEDENGGLFNIEVSSADESANEEKVPRDFQSEEDYQRQRTTWRPKVETGEVIDSYPILSLKTNLLVKALENTQTPNGQSDKTRVTGYFARH